MTRNMGGGSDWKWPQSDPCYHGYSDVYSTFISMSVHQKARVEEDEDLDELDGQSRLAPPVHRCSSHR